MLKRSPFFSQIRPVPSGLLLLIFIVACSCCMKRSRDKSLSSRSREQPAIASPPTQTLANDQQPATPTQTTRRININTAAAAELEKLPGIGQALAARIIEHRERSGPFRRPEHLIIVRGISDRKFRALRDLITVE